MLLDHLRPPPGCHLDAGVATTFTLDLGAALVAPLAFASFEISETSDPLAIMEAVRSCTDRLDLFCQAGQIRCPRQASDLMAFLEPMVHEVLCPRPHHLFHPKIWVLRYAGEDGDLPLRLLVQTRNLTDDHSWDAVVRLDGMVGSRVHASNRPLAELLQWLRTNTVQPLSEARSDNLDSLAEDLRRAEWERPEGVLEIAFHVFGVPGVRSTADFSGNRHLVVSPFLDDGGLEHVASTASTQVTVVSRVLTA